MGIEKEYDSSYDFLSHQTGVFLYENRAMHCFLVHWALFSWKILN